MSAPLLEQARAVARSHGGLLYFVRLATMPCDRIAVVTPEGWFWGDCDEPVRACVQCHLYTCNCDETWNESHESCRREMAALETAALATGLPRLAVSGAADNVVRDWQYTDWATLGGKLGAQRGASRKRKGGETL